jgi:hypothetical protein
MVLYENLAAYSRIVPSFRPFLKLRRLAIICSNIEPCTGRFSLRGSELGWTKSWLWNLGITNDSSARFKLRFGLNLKTYKAYMRLRFRTEPISPFDFGDGLVCTGKVGLPGLLTVLGSKPLRVEYLMRINTPAPDFAVPRGAFSRARGDRTEGGGYGRGDRDRPLSLRTGIEHLSVSLDELDFCLDWDEDSPVWGIGLQADKPKKMISYEQRRPGSRAAPGASSSKRAAGSARSGGGGSGSGGGGGGDRSDRGTRAGGSGSSGRDRSAGGSRQMPPLAPSRAPI